MALGATVYKATIDISDLDRGYYGNHVLTVARHPSETEERMMIRILAFTLLAGERLEFGRGLSTEGEPALWEINDTGEIGHWVEVGCPDVKQVRRACGKSDLVTIIAYGEDKVQAWWNSNARELNKLEKLSVLMLKDETVEKLGALATRNMKFSVTIQDSMIWFSDDRGTLQIEFEALKQRQD